MITLALVSSVAFLAAGLLVKWLADHRGGRAMRRDRPEVTPREYASGAAIGVALCFFVSWVGYSLVISSATNYEEFINGWETSAYVSDTKCVRNGSCRWCYDCDPYIESYSCNCSTSSKGTRSCSTCYRTKYHSCPYASFEREFGVNTTIGGFTYATGVMPPNPQANRFRALVAIPDSVIASAGTMPPQAWVDAKRRIEMQQPAPATKKAVYKNYILASDRTLMKTYSSDIATYKSAGLLPPIPSAVNRYTSTRALFVGGSTKDTAAWIKGVEYLNGAFGNELRGTIFLVVFDALKIPNIDRYTLALKAYWQSKEVFDSAALPKNALVLVIGTKDWATVDSSRAFTGMPIGNEGTTVALRSMLQGRPLQVESLIGNAVSLTGVPVKYHTATMEPLVGAILWGKAGDPTTRFRRVSMSGRSGGPGFLYLKGEISPKPWQSALIFVLAMLLSGIFWYIAYHGDLDFITPMLEKLGIEKRGRRA